MSQEGVWRRGAGGDLSSSQGSQAVPPPTTPGGWTCAHLHGGDLHGRGTCGGGRARRHGGLRLCLGMGLGLHLSQGLLRDHEQLPILAPHEDHTWGAGEGGWCQECAPGPDSTGSQQP